MNRDLKTLEKRRAHFDAKVKYPENFELFSEYLEWHAYKLKRQNNLRELDRGAVRTLTTEMSRLLNVEAWFDKPLKDITREDIRRVYDDLEDGKILNARGVPFRSLDSYYGKLFKSKLFRMIGKDEMAREVIEFVHKEYSEVRFVTEKTFRKIADHVSRSDRKALLWLAFDVGENINSLVRLRKEDLRHRVNPVTGEEEFLVTLQSQNLKRSRTARTEPTRYPETVSYLKEVLSSVKEGPIFSFEYAQAAKFLRTAVKKAKATTEGTQDARGAAVRWKDLRSGMACDLLLKGASTDEVKARLGHRPSSTVIDRYVNYLALDRDKFTQKVHQTNMSVLQAELSELKHQNRLIAQRREEEQERMRNREAELREDVNELKRQLEVFARLHLESRP